MLNAALVLTRPKSHHANSIVPATLAISGQVLEQNARTGHWFPNGQGKS
jgi:hypothetical protein